MKSSRLAKNVDEYIGAAPTEAREMLSQIRAVFRKVAPEAEERISYHMPYFYYRGPVGGFAAYKNHVSLFGSLPDGLAEELRSYKTGRGSIQFRLDKPLPLPLVTRLVKAHLKANEAGTEEGAR